MTSGLRAPTISPLLAKHGARRPMVGRLRPDRQTMPPAGRTALVALAAMTVLGMASTADAAKLPASYYWTAAKANAAVVAQATVTQCLPGSCPPGTITRHSVSAARCAGLPGFGIASGRYSRFRCAFDTTNDWTHGHLEVRTAGPTLIRWKRLDASL